MIFTKHKKLLAFFIVLALAVSLPAAALAEADTTAPTVTLYSPTTSAASSRAGRPTAAGRFRARLLESAAP